MEPYYDRDDITIYHGDCRDVLPSVDPASVALLLTDPPYGIAHDTDYTRFVSGKSYAPIAGDTGPFDPTPFISTFRQVALFGANYFHVPLGRWVIWIKRDADEFKKALMSDAEMLWHNCPAKPVETFNWYWSGAFRKGEMGSHLHPTQKPVALMKWLLEKWTTPGDLILDPYMGSGPIAAAAYQLGRRYIGVELVEEYCRAAVNRLAQPTLGLMAAD